MHKKIVFIFTILLLFISVFATQQNIPELKRLAEKLKTEYDQKRAEAYQKAAQMNWPITFTTDEGSFAELQVLDEFGMPQYYITHNANAAQTISTDEVYSGGSAGLSLDGTGIIVREWDGGGVLTTHQEFGGRVTQVDSPSGTHYHSTHVAGTIMASGVVANAKGMAFAATLRAFDWNSDTSEMASEAALGALISNHIDKLEELNINAINLSIDSLQKEKFAKITRRDVFDGVYDTLEKLDKSNLKLKLNIVVQSGFNTDEIIDFIELSKDKDIAVRFIEEMPFNGKGQRDIKEEWNFNKIINHVNEHYAVVETLQDKKSSTSKNFRIPNYKGTFGIIPAFTRTICNDCNRIRITATGLFKNCLFDGGVFNVRDFMRDGASDDELKALFISTIHKKPKNGFIAEAARGDNVTESMSTIGG